MNPSTTPLSLCFAVFQNTTSTSRTQNLEAPELVIMLCQAKTPAGLSLCTVLANSITETSFSQHISMP